jgi:hypothetical protein
LNFRERKGIAQIVIVGIIVIVIVVAAAGAYFAFSSGGSSPGTTSTTQSSSTRITSTTQTGTTTSSAGTTSTTAVTTSSTSSTSSAVSTSTTYSTFSCASTYTTTTGTPTDYTPQYIALIQQFSAIEFKVSETNGTVTHNETLSYMVTSASGGIYNVNMSFASSTSSTTVTFAVDSNNNTVLSVSVSGQSLPKSYAKAEFDALMGVFGLQQSLGNQLSIFTDSAYFHSTGTSSMTFGQATFPVTTYVANTLPESFTSCGVTSNITAYTLQVGTPTGTSLLFITYLHFEGTSSSFSGTDNVTFQLVSMTVG